VSTHRLLTLIIAGLSLAACSGGNGDTSGSNGASTADGGSVAEEAAPMAAADARPAAFAVCASCHRTGKGEPHGVGPNLFGTFGVKAAVHEGFTYSPALKASGVVWDEATLHTWLEKPSALVPGNRMIYAGQPDAAKRQQIIDYLKTLH
jgi:cytochrome c